MFDHNHDLSPGKACFDKSNKKLDLQLKKRLELNDLAGIKGARTSYLWSYKLKGVRT